MYTLQRKSLSIITLANKFHIAIVGIFLSLGFEYPGSHSGQNNYNSENTFVIMKGKSDLGQYEKAYNYIRERIEFYKSQKNAPAVVQISPEEELMKYKAILDSGIITQEEFDKKKSEFLGI